MSNNESFSVSLVSEDFPLVSKLLVFENGSCFSWSRQQGQVHVLTDCARIRSNSIGFTLKHFMCSLRWHALHSTARLFLAMVLPQDEHSGGPVFIETSPLRTIRVVWKVEVEFVECFTRDAKNPFLGRWVKSTWRRCNRTVVTEYCAFLRKYCAVVLKYHYTIFPQMKILILFTKHRNNGSRLSSFPPCIGKRNFRNKWNRNLVKHRSINKNMDVSMGRMV